MFRKKKKFISLTHEIKVEFCAIQNNRYYDLKVKMIERVTRKKKSSKIFAKSEGE